MNELEERFESITGINFNDFYKEHRTKLKWYLTKYTNKHIDELEDYVDDTFFNALIYLDQYKKPEDGGSKLITWIYKIGENIIKMNHNRSNGKLMVKTTSFDYFIVNNYTLNDIIPDNGVIDYLELKEEKLINKQKAEFVIKCIYQLEDERHKKALILREINHMKMKEIAEEMNSNISSVKNWLRKGRSIIKKQVERKFR